MRDTKLKIVAGQISEIKYNLRRYRKRLKNATKLVKDNDTIMTNGKTIAEFNRQRRKRDLATLPKHIEMLMDNLNRLLAERAELKKKQVPDPVMIQLIFDF